MERPIACFHDGAGTMKRGYPWTPAEDAVLRGLRARGDTWDAIEAAMPKRSGASCAARFRYLRVLDAQARMTQPPRIETKAIEQTAEFKPISLPVPWHDPRAARLGCEAHAAALARFYRNRELRRAA